MYLAPQYNFVSKSAAVSQPIEFTPNDESPNKVSHNFINNIIKINSFSDESLEIPAKPIDGTFKIYVKLLGNDAWRLLSENTEIQAATTGGAKMDETNDTELNSVTEPSFTGHPTHIRIVPNKISGAAYYRVAVVQDSQGVL